MTYEQSIWKRKIEALLAWPFVMLGKILAPLFPLKSKHGIFIFCPSADIGGANKVNADLCSIFADKSPLVIFPKSQKIMSSCTSFKKTVSRSLICIKKWIIKVFILSIFSTAASSLHGSTNRKILL